MLIYKADPLREKDMPKGRKRVKGVPELHNELKKQVNLALTPTGIQGLDTMATALGVSRSELVERIGRGIISVSLGNMVLVSQKGLLPRVPAIYIVRSGTQILFIGQCKDLSELKQKQPAGVENCEGNLSIARIECSDISLLPVIERALVESINSTILDEKIKLLNQKISDENMSEVSINFPIETAIQLLFVLRHSLNIAILNEL